MEAPEKIYLQVCGDCNDDDCQNCKFRDLEDNATCCMDKIFDKDIEYVRTDAFIDKACEWIKEHSYDYLEFGEAGFGANFHYPKMIEDFRKAMKKE